MIIFNEGHMMKKIFSIILISIFTFYGSLSIAQTTDTLEGRLKLELLRLGFADGKLPPLSKVFGPYEPYVVVDKDIYLTSAAPQRPDGTWVKGLVSNEMELEELIYTAELSGISALNRLKFAAGGDLNNIARILHVNILLPVPQDFPHLEKIADITSLMLVRVFGHEIGRHSRTILSVTSLPVNMTHEIEVRAILK